MQGSEINNLSKAAPDSKEKQRLDAADKMLARARQLGEAWYAEQGRSEDASSNAAVVLYTKLDVWVGRYVLGKQVGQRSFGSLAELGDAWAAEFGPAAGAFSFSRPPTWTGRDLMPIEEPEGDLDGGQEKKKKPRASGQSKGKAKQDDVSLELYEMNADGEVTSALGRLLNAGFALGSTVTLGADDVWAVSAVEGENVRLVAVGQEAEDGDCAVQTVTASSFLHHAKHVQAKGMVVKHPAWPGARTSRLQSTKESLVRARVWTAMECLMSAMECDIEEKLQIYVKPKKSVSTLVEFAHGKLRLVPEPTAVKILGASCLPTHDESPPGLVEVVLDKSPLDPTPHRVFLASGSGDSALSPYWVVEHVASEDEANMTLVWYKVSHVSGVDPVMASCIPGAHAPPSTSAALEARPEVPGAFAKSGVFAKPTSKAAAAPGGLPRAATASQGSPGAATESQLERKRLAAMLSATPDHTMTHEVTVPVMVNTKALPAGTSLKIAFASRKAPSKSTKAISVVALAKKQRV